MLSFDDSSHIIQFPDATMLILLWQKLMKVENATHAAVNVEPTKSQFICVDAKFALLMDSTLIKMYTFFGVVIILRLVPKEYDYDDFKSL